MKTKTLFWIGALCLPLLVRAGVVTIELPVETATFKPGKDVEVVQGNCLRGHLQP